MAQKLSFTEWLHKQNGLQMSKWSLKFDDADGDTLHSTERGVFRFKGRTLDLNGLVPDSTLTQNFTRFKAFLFFKYEDQAAKKGFEAGEFEDAWAEEQVLGPDDDDEPYDYEG